MENKVPMELWENTVSYLAFYWNCSSRENQLQLCLDYEVPIRRIEILINGEASVTVENYMTIKKYTDRLKDLETRDYWNGVLFGDAKNE